jgi:hypothetical protein
VRRAGNSRAAGLARDVGVAWSRRCKTRRKRGRKFVVKVRRRGRDQTRAFTNRALGHPERLGRVEIPREPRQADIAQAPIAKRRWILASKGAADCIQIQQLASVRHHLAHGHLPVRMPTIQLRLARNVIASTEALFLTVGREGMPIAPRRSVA